MPPHPPSVDALARDLDDGTLPPPLLTEVARAAVAEARESGGDATGIGRRHLHGLRGVRLTRVVNATGVLLHTNLGRAALSSEAAAALATTAANPANVEFDLENGRRGGRGQYAGRLLASLTAAESALIVNNAAGALLLALAALAGNAATVVSRGELIEIGGSFRLPDLMAASGSLLREVGTTNRTRPDDYRSQIDTDTAALLKVHPSNYRVEGFTDEVPFPQVAEIAREHGLISIADVGSGLLDARTPWIDGPPPAWAQQEPAMRQMIQAGFDVVIASGDKLFGGPQAGLVVGRSSAITAMARHPIARAVRASGPVLAAVAATAEQYANGTADRLPFWRAAGLPVDEIRRRSEAVVAASGVAADVVEGTSVPGAGTVPGVGIPTAVVRIVSADADDMWRRLLAAEVPVVARRQDGAVMLDLRSAPPDDDPMIIEALTNACRS